MADGTAPEAEGVEVDGAWLLAAARRSVRHVGGWRRLPRFLIEDAVSQTIIDAIESGTLAMAVDRAHLLKLLRHRARWTIRNMRVAHARTGDFEARYYRARVHARDDIDDALEREQIAAQEGRLDVALLAAALRLLSPRDLDLVFAPADRGATLANLARRYRRNVSNISRRRVLLIRWLAGTVARSRSQNRTPLIGCHVVGAPA